MATVIGRAAVGGQVFTPTAALTLPAAAATVYGIPAGVTLTPRSGGLQLGTGGTATRLDIKGPFRSTAGALPVPVLTECRITATGADDGAYFGGYSLVRCEITGSADGAKANSYASFDHCYIHDLYAGPGEHNDGIQITNGSHVQILDTKIVNSNPQTSCILIGSDQGPIDDVLIRGGFMEIAWNSQSGFCIYPGDPGCTNIRLEGINFSTRYGKGRALYPSRPKTGWMRGCKYDDGTPIPDETWG